MPASRILYDYALRFVGTNYKWGGSNPISGFDCSGFAQEVLASEGWDPIGDQSAQALHDTLKPKSLSNQVGLGALVFYGLNDKSITHVEVMLSDLHTIGANGGGSKVVDAKSADQFNAFIRVRKLGHRKDIVAILMPNYD